MLENSRGQKQSHTTPWFGHRDTPVAPPRYDISRTPAEPSGPPYAKGISVNPIQQQPISEDCNSACTESQLDHPPAARSDEGRQHEEAVAQPSTIRTALMLLLLPQQKLCSSEAVPSQPTPLPRQLQTQQNNKKYNRATAEAGHPQARPKATIYLPSSPLCTSGSPKQRPDRNRVLYIHPTVVVRSLLSTRRHHHHLLLRPVRLAATIWLALSTVAACFLLNVTTTGDGLDSIALSLGRNKESAQTQKEPKQQQHVTVRCFPASVLPY